MARLASLRTHTPATIIALAALLLGAAGPTAAQDSAYEHFEQGKQLLQVKKYPQAAEAFRQAAEREPDEGLYVDWLGKVLVDEADETGGLAAAVSTLASLRGRSDTWEVRYWLGRARYLQGGSTDLAAAKDLLSGLELPHTERRMGQMLADIETRLEPSGADDDLPPPVEDAPWITLVALAVILALSVTVVVALRRFAFDEAQPSRGRDALLLVTFVLVLAFAAAMLGILDGDQLVKVFTSVVPDAAPAKPAPAS